MILAATGDFLQTSQGVEHLGRVDKDARLGSELRGLEERYSN